MSSFLVNEKLSVDLIFFHLSIFRIVLLLAVYFTCILFIQRPDRFNKLTRKKSSFSYGFMTFWLIYAMYSIIWSFDSISWLKAVTFIFIGYICIIIIGICLNAKDILISMNIMGSMIFLHNVIGWFEVLTRKYYFLTLENYKFYTVIEDRIPISMMGGPNEFALLMLLGIFISYICIKINHLKMVKLFFVFTMASSIILLFLTGSRGNIIGFFVGMCCFVYLKLKNKKGCKAFCMIIFPIAMILIFYITPIEGVLKKVLEFNFSVMNSEVIRVNLLRNGIKFIFETFGFGTGAGNIEYWMKNKAVYNIGNITNIHNWWGEIGVGYGIVVFVLYIKFFIKLFQDLMKIYKKSKDDNVRSVSMGLLCCMSGFVIGSMSSSSNLSSEWLWVFWAVAIAFQGNSLDDIAPKTC